MEDSYMTDHSYHREICTRIKDWLEVEEKEQKFLIETADLNYPSANYGP